MQQVGRRALRGESPVIEVMRHLVMEQQVAQLLKVPVSMQATKFVPVIFTVSRPIFTVSRPIGLDQLLAPPLVASVP